MTRRLRSAAARRATFHGRQPSSLWFVPEVAERYSRWLWVAALVAAVALLSFTNSLDGEFVFDDRPFLVDNPKLGQTHSLAWFFRENLWFYSNIEGAFSASYRPLFFLTLWSLDTIGFGGAHALHGFSLGLHLLAS